MKLITTLFTFILLITSPVHAVEKDLYMKVEAQVKDYYSASGVWNVIRVKKIERIKNSSSEFILVSAKVQIQNIETAIVESEVCIVTFTTDDQEFFAINCFQ